MSVEYTSERPYTVLIEGLSGSGKSTFLRDFQNDDRFFVVSQILKSANYVGGVYLPVIVSLNFFAYIRSIDQLLMKIFS